MINPDSILQAIDAIPSLKEESERGYVGASEIGHPCMRYLWLKHHRLIEHESFDPEEADIENLEEAKQEATKARLRRLFQRGHDEEYRFKDLLHAIGAKFKNTNGEQSGFRNGFFAGHADDELFVFNEDAIAEYKTHNRKWFNTLKRGTLEEKFPKHFGQAQCYMKAFGKTQCIYLAVCKDDDRLFCDVIQYDEKKADAYYAKAEYIAMTDKPPDRVCNKPTFYLSKMCKAKDVCFGFDLPRINCRNCVNATKFKSTGSFGCELKRPSDSNNQLDERGWCEDHCFNPHYMSNAYGWQILEFHPKERAVQYANVINGPAPFGVPSKELKID